MYYSNSKISRGLKLVLARTRTSVTRLWLDSKKRDSITTLLPTCKCNVISHLKSTQSLEYWTFLLCAFLSCSLNYSSDCAKLLQPFHIYLNLPANPYSVQYGKCLLLSWTHISNLNCHKALKVFYNSFSPPVAEYILHNNASVDSLLPRAGLEHLGKGWIVRATTTRRLKIALLY